MSAIINELNQQQKSMLFQSLINTKELAETKYTEAVLAKENNMDEVELLNKRAAFSKWMEEGIQELINKLFGETFVEDYSFLENTFEKEYQNKNSNSDISNPV